MIPQKGRLRLILPIDPHAYAGHALARDITGLGHWGVGNLEATLDTEDQLDLVMSWVEEAARQTRAG